ncbi:GTA-2-like_protein [Hexamita inflata]|uniref:GTA-2-like_protein n=1 Tax=Hexamita inflata TaxID=28002 RepID=A0ABP1H6W3_9EUKA
MQSHSNYQNIFYTTCNSIAIDLKLNTLEQLYNLIILTSYIDVLMYIVMGTWTKTAQNLSAALLEGYGMIDMPVWKERATNLVGITMLGKPDGNRVVKILGLI